MSEKNFTDPRGGSAVLFVPGQRLTVTMTDSACESAYQMRQCTVVGCSGTLVEVEWDGKKVIVNIGSPNFVKVISDE